MRAIAFVLLALLVVAATPIASTTASAGGACVVVDPYAREIRVNTGCSPLKPRTPTQSTDLDG